MRTSLARVREKAGGVDVVVDSLGGPISLCSFRALRPGGMLVVFGRYSTLSHGHKNWQGVFEWWASIVTTWLWAKLSPRRKVFAYHVQKWRDRAAMRPGSVEGEPMDADWFRQDFNTMIELLRERKIHPVGAERLPLAEARHAHELLESSASEGKLVLVPYQREHITHDRIAPAVAIVGWLKYLSPFYYYAGHDPHAGRRHRRSHRPRCRQRLRAAPGMFGIERRDLRV
ncbi:MAG: zinc-binding dehydrogenase [Solirubrobacteraceae bacterium]